jgi:hypothetical protein
MLLSLRIDFRGKSYYKIGQLQNFCCDDFTQFIDIRRLENIRKRKISFAIRIDDLIQTFK